jgi:fatty acid desaturase
VGELLRYRADRIPLALVGSTLALSLAPVFFHVPVAALALVWFPLLLLKIPVPCAEHSHAHLRVFRSRVANFLYELALARVSGYVTSIWEIHHNLGHHRNYLTPALDVASSRDGSGGHMSVWRYIFLGDARILFDCLRVARGLSGPERRRVLARLFSQLALQWAGTLALLAYAPWATLAFLLVPARLLRWTVWWASYWQHHEVDGTSAYDGARTQAGWFYNFATLNSGHHAAHHEKPTLHWSLLPKRTAIIRDRIPDRLITGDRRPGPPRLRTPIELRPREIPARRSFRRTTSAVS